MDTHARLRELAKIADAPAPVVSVYLDTRWADEHQRDRVRVFLKNQLDRARGARQGRAADADLDWIEAQGAALVAQTTAPDAVAVALFACEPLGLRELLRVPRPVGEAFVVADAPHLGPLAAALEQAPAAFAVFIDGESARLIPLAPGAAADEVRLESEVPGHHRRGAWAQLAQSRYQRHVQEHRARHFDAVADSLSQLVQEHDVRRLVLVGDPRNVAIFQKALPPRLAPLVIGVVAGGRHESADLIAARGAALVEHHEGQRAAEALDAVLTAAAKGGRGVSGIEQTLEAIGRGAVQRLYLLAGFSGTGRLCTACGGLRAGSSSTCPSCGAGTVTRELAEAATDRVLAAGGVVERIEAHSGLAQAGGIAAQLRYPL